MEVLQAITTRRSVRAYDSRPLEGKVRQRLCRALRYAPSACNIQPWKFVLVGSEPLRRAVATACKGQMWMAQAPLIVVACGYPDRAYKKMGGAGNSVDIDVAIALDHLTLVAVSEGLGTCWIGAFDEQAVKKILGIPDAVKVVSLMPVGYPAEADLNHPVAEERRKSPDEIFCNDMFSA